MYEASVGSIRTPSLARQKLVLWLALGIILSVSLLAFVSIERLIAANERVQDRLTLIVELNRYLSDLKDVETGGRGYALSDGDIRHLQRQNAGIAAVEATERRLQALSHEPELQRQVDRLVPLTDERIAASRRLIAERTNLEATRHNLLFGLQLMDKIRDEVAAILATQQSEYRDERLHLERQAWITSIALATGIILCLIAIAWLFSLRGREVERRRQLEEELRALNLDLEDRVQDRTAEVKHARDLLNAVVENLPDTILLKEPVEDGFSYLLINAAGERLLGRDRDQILGRTERDLFPPEEADQVVEANRAVIASGRPRMLTDRKLTTATGVRTVETRMVPIAHNGNPVMILAMIRDVTDAIAREEQFRQLQRMDAVGRLTGGVAHDFNNLLAIIHGNSELLRERLEDGSDAATMTDDVIGAAARGAELVRRLLAFARMQHLEPESIDLNARLQNVLGLLQRALGENVTLRVKTAKKLWPATVDPTQVDDALVNLAINARDAMPEGGTLSIETQNVALDEDYAASHVEVAPGDYVMLAVSDTGCGMTARRDRPRIRALLHHQGRGPGHGPRPQPGVRLGQAVARPHQDLQRGRPRDDGQALSAAGRKAIGRQAGGSRDRHAQGRRDDPGGRGQPQCPQDRRQAASRPWLQDRRSGKRRAGHAIGEGRAGLRPAADRRGHARWNHRIPARRSAADRPAGSQGPVLLRLYRACRCRRGSGAQGPAAQQAIPQAGPGADHPRHPRRAGDFQRRLNARRRARASQRARLAV